MAFNLLNIGSQALLANKTALSTVGQNIANASTEGYSRQEANFVSVVGRQGTYIQDIDRATNQFVVQQYWSDLASFSSLNIQDSLISQTDNLLATSSTNISAALDTYFQAMQNVVDDPTSTANRELFIAEADSLTDRFNSLYANLSTQNDAVNATMTVAAENLSDYTKSVAQLNDQISYLKSVDQPVNELLDQRDVLVNKIAEIVDINVVEQGDSYNIFIGNGQPLIVGQAVNEVEIRQGDPDHTQPELYVMHSGAEVNVTQQVSGGVLGGLKDFRNEVLNPAFNELGRIALALADETNTQHNKGLDLNNEFGGDVFTDINSDAALRSRVSADSENLSTINYAYVTVDDVSELTVNDYLFKIANDDTITLKRLPTESIINLTQVAAATDVVDGTYYLDSGTGVLKAKLDGIDVEIKGNSYLAVGDEFLVQPTRNQASLIESVISDPSQLALASPVSVTTNPNNNGTATASVKVVDPASSVFDKIADTGQLDPPIEIVFTENATGGMEYSIYDVSNPDDPQLLEEPAQVPPIVPAPLYEKEAYVSGQEFIINGIGITIAGEPRVGDRFTFEFNKDGISDNRNALALSEIQDKKILSNGSMQDHYSGLIEKIGSKAAAGQINLIASESVLQSTQSTLASIIGVNLDEEAARLVQYQQAYSASAQLITTSQTLFDTLLNSF
ncbi:flagellar hook-associated protein FlgK [Gammaproteobacteria bacterium AS21]